jgi:hypothetical protein
METDGNGLETIKGANDYSCEHCNKEFKNRSGLWKHKHKGGCAIISQPIQYTSSNDDENQVITQSKDGLIMMLIKQNADLIKEQSIFIKEQSNLIKEQTDIKQIIMELVKTVLRTILLIITIISTHITKHLI